MGRLVWLLCIKNQRGIKTAHLFIILTPSDAVKKNLKVMVFFRFYELSGLPAAAMLRYRSEAYRPGGFRRRLSAGAQPQ